MVFSSYGEGFKGDGGGGRDGDRITGVGEQGWIE